MMISNSILSSFKEMIKCCQEIQTLLSNDLSHFSKNEYVSIEENNKKKFDLLNKLNSLAVEINTRHADGSPANFLEKLAQDPNYSTPTAQHEINHILQELKSEIEKCYKHVMTNSDVVFSNIQQLKYIWDQLLSKSDNHVYDRIGNVAK